jgi:hypothetical protein
MKHAVSVLVFTAFLLCSGLPVSAQIYVPDWTTGQQEIAADMAGVTGVFRAALEKTGMADLTTQQKGARYVITGTVTRFGDYSAPRSSENDGSEGTDPAKTGLALSSLASAIPGLSVYAPQIISVFGIASALSGSGGKKKSAAQEDAEQKAESRRTIIAASMADASTGRVVASASMTCLDWKEYVENIEDFAANFLNKLPVPSFLYGAWEGEADGFAGTYNIIFSGHGRCTVQVTDASGKTLSGRGHYRYNDQILTVSVPSAGVNWKAVAVHDGSGESFNVVIPVTQGGDAQRVRMTFWKD